MKNNISGTIDGRGIFLFLILLMIVTSLFSQQHVVRIAAVGNSITWGAKTDNPKEDAYSNQLNQMLSEVYGDTCLVMNYGHSGCTMMRNAEPPIWKESEFKNALKFVPNICLILLGTNDSKPYRWETWGNEFLSDYLAMIDTFKVRNPDTRFIVCYPPPIWKEHTYGDTFEKKHNDSIVVNQIIPLIDSVVSKTNALLIDFHTPFIDSVHLFPDYLHPNAQGCKIMAQMIFDTIQKYDLIHAVDTGMTFISSFEQMVPRIAIGKEVTISWSTLFADSVFLDGIHVDPEGSTNVTAEEGKSFKLTAKGPKNTAELTLVLTTYIPEKTRLKITRSLFQPQTGEETILYVEYLDQYGMVMDEKTTGISWSITQGDGEFGEQSDTSIIFIPGTSPTVFIRAFGGDLEVEHIISVKVVNSVIQGSNKNKLNIFPNPVYDVLYLGFQSRINSDVQISVYDLAGKEILNREFTGIQQESSLLTIDTKDINPGIYILEVIVGKEKRVKRFLKANTR